ncbi:MAG: hypothetical protein KAR17_21340 [Cyclobacteriaceae bacterium]|nr:hypothetical protein [Cyclobacteriaceae bacterium]
MIDFYWNRDDYTQKYCLYLDEGITQCRASCYLENLLKDQHKDKSEAKLISSQQYKMTELISYEKIDFSNLNKLEKHRSFYDSGPYQFDFLHFVFHPPKG